jgi:hypothetical protein
MAIDFPSTPVADDPYEYGGVRYIYKDTGGGKGYWKVNTVSTIGPATFAEINAGTVQDRFLSPFNLANSKFQEALDNTGTSASKDVGTDAGNVMEIGTSGVGDAVRANGYDFNNPLLLNKGMSYHYAFSTLNPPIGNFSGHVFNMGSIDGAQGSFQLASRIGSDNHFIRSSQDRDFGKIFTDKNLNPNVFGAQDRSASIVAEGFRGNSSIVTFVLSVSLINSASSILVSGSFDVTDTQGVTVTGGSNVSLNINGGSSNKLCIINATGLSGIVSGTEYILKQASSGANITVS